MTNDQVMEVLTQLKELKPLVTVVIDGLKEYKDEWEQLKAFLQQEMVQSRTTIFNGFIAEGFSREEAMTLTLATVKDGQMVLESYKKNLGNNA